MPAAISVRPFRESDFDRILEIEHASFGADAYDRNLFAEFFHKCGGLFLIALASGNICGYIVTCMRGPRAPHAAELVSLAVHPGSRGKGVASSLLTNTLRRLRLRRAVRLSLVVKVTNRPARRFYEKSGFRKVRTIPKYYEDSTDGILMSKPL